MSLQRQVYGSMPDKPKAAFIPPHRGVVQRKCACGGSSASGGACGSCAAEDKKRVRRHPAPPQAVASSARAGDPAPGVVREALRGPSSTLDSSTRGFFESRFDRDFSQVRVHSDATAERSARSIDALAYTVGNDVVFGKGQYSPHSESGRRLLAHELTHVTQQRGATASQLTLGEAHDASEREADRAAESLAFGDAPSRDVGARVQRTPAPPSYRSVTGVLDLDKLHIDAVNDFVASTLTTERIVNAHVLDPDIKHLTWMLYDPNDRMLAGFSTLPGRADSTTRPFKLLPRDFSGASLVAGKHVLRCAGLNASHEPIVYADRDFNVLKSDLTLGTALPTTHGDLTFTRYGKTDAPAAGSRYFVDVALEFMPKSTVACPSIWFLQTVRAVDDSGRNMMPIASPAHDERKTKLAWTIDRVAGAPSPFYGTKLNAAGALEMKPGFGASGAGGSSASAVKLEDTPNWDREQNVQFESCAVCRGGATDGQVYGCATWGFKATSTGKVTMMPRGFRQMPSDQFVEARTAWNTWRMTKAAASRPEAAPALVAPPP
jgi:hypothetical protein